MNWNEAEFPAINQTFLGKRESRWWNIDPYLFWSMFLLLLLGILMVFSASMTTALYAYGDVFYFLKRHLLGIGIGFIFLTIFTFISLERLRGLNHFLLLATFVCLILVFIPGIGKVSGGSYRWINLGVFSFQPSELAKLSIILYLADALANYKERVEDFRRGIVPFLILVGLICLLVLIEPDLSTAFFLFLIAFVMLFLGGSKLQHLLLILIVLIPSGIFLIFFGGKEYWQERILAFWDPWKDPLGTGFHTIQSLIALGSGGMVGRGLGESRQKFFFLPDRHTDFIFAIIGEELGFVGTSLVVVLFAIILWRGWKIAQEAQDEFLGLLAMGITISIILQVFINMGAVLKLIPVTGVTLPLVSYGNSSLIVTLSELGILFNIARGRE